MERCTCKVCVLLIKPLVSRCRPVVGSIDMVDVNCQNWPIIGDTRPLTIWMENPGILGRIQMDCSSRRKFSGKKYLSRYYLFPVFTETTEIFCTICLDYQWKALSREREKNLPVFCKWYNSIPFLFSAPKKKPVPFDGNFSTKFPYKR